LEDGSELIICEEDEEFAIRMVSRRRGSQEG